MAKTVVTLVSGLSLSDPKAQLEITFDEENLVITETGFSGFKKKVANTFRIPLSNVLETMVTTEEEFYEKQKSVVGRGLAGGIVGGVATGGILFLPGVILGGLSGLGKKQKSKNLPVYLVSYVSSTGEPKGITFSLPALSVLTTKGFDTALKKKLKTVARSDAAKSLLEPKDITL
jgi:hypothetical protein